MKQSGIISHRPLNKNDSAKNIDSVNIDPKGDENTTILSITNNTPTNNGMYQCLIVSLIDCKNEVCMILNFG